MCGIAGCFALDSRPLDRPRQRLELMSELVKHRGPDGDGVWIHPREIVGFAHRRLAILDLATGQQPMTDGSGTWVTFNGQIYNYVELREELGADSFRTTSDTEVILRAYRTWGPECVEHFRGMFAFAIWDEETGSLFCARDRAGIKPFYYTLNDTTFQFASEAKALLPFLPSIETDLDALKDYLAFQACLDGKTLFRGVRELLPGHTLSVRAGTVTIRRYWDVRFDPDVERPGAEVLDELRSLTRESVRIHMRSDVPVGAYLSGGLDSSIVTSLAAELHPGGLSAYLGKFTLGPAYDESPFARELAAQQGIDLHELEISVDDLIANMGRVAYHMDYPAAGPGAFPQYMVSRLAASQLKVVLGGQGGDELFGGYARYLVAYLEQCLKGAIDGTMDPRRFIVSYASILPNLGALRAYKPMLQEFWREGLFDDMDRRYFRLVSRAERGDDAVRWNLLGDYSPYSTFRSVFFAENVRSDSYFDHMTHFDFKALLPSLLQVEDRVSMAHGLESRLPYLDHPVIELAARIPAAVKFEGGRMKRALIAALGDTVPKSIAERTDKMGFPTPFNIWAQGPAHDYVRDILTGPNALGRDLIDNRAVLRRAEDEGSFGRTFWGMFNLELWQQTFHDRAAEYRAMFPAAEVPVTVGAAGRQPGD